MGEHFSASKVRGKAPFLPQHWMAWLGVWVMSWSMNWPICMTRMVLSPSLLSSVCLDLPRKSTAGNVELPSARAISNALSRETEERRDGDNTILVMQMGQFIDHDITHTPNHAIQCCGRNGAFPRTFDAEKCSPE